MEKLIKIVRKIIKILLFALNFYLSKLSYGFRELRRLIKINLL